MSEGPTERKLPQNYWHVKHVMPSARRIPPNLHIYYGWQQNCRTWTWNPYSKSSAKHVIYKYPPTFMLPMSKNV